MHTRFQILILALCSLLLCACRGDEVIYPTIGTHVTDEVRTGGLYVLCEGNMGSNKARLDYINLEKGDYYSNWYGAQNPRQMKELGDVGNDIQQYGGRLYAVINCSHKVEVMDLRARHIGQVDLPNCRYLAFAGDKMYVSAYVGSVADPELLGSVYEVDTATLQVTRACPNSTFNRTRSNPSSSSFTSHTTFLKSFQCLSVLSVTSPCNSTHRRYLIQ